jgi:hypothetical protein
VLLHPSQSCCTPPRMRSLPCLPSVVATHGILVHGGVLVQMAERNGVHLPYADLDAAKAARSNYGSLEVRRTGLSDGTLCIPVLCTEN